MAVVQQVMLQSPGPTERRAIDVLVHPAWSPGTYGTDKHNRGGRYSHIRRQRAGGRRTVSGQQWGFNEAVRQQTAGCVSTCGDLLTGVATSVTCERPRTVVSYVPHIYDRVTAFSWLRAIR